MLVLVMRFWIRFLNLALLCLQNLLFLGMQVSNLDLLDSIASPFDRVILLPEFGISVPSYVACNSNVPPIV